MRKGPHPGRMRAFFAFGNDGGEGDGGEGKKVASLMRLRGCSMMGYAAGLRLFMLTCGMAG